MQQHATTSTYRKHHHTLLTGHKDVTDQTHMTLHSGVSFQCPKGVVLLFQADECPHCEAVIRHIIQQLFHLVRLQLHS